MDWFFDNDRPIYLQLVEQLKIFIISGIYKPGDKLPSVRDFALDTQVNPNTMQKALIELEDIGLINTKRTSGKYVTDDIMLIKKIKEEFANQKVLAYLKDMQALGYSKSEAIEYLEKIRKDD